MYDTASELYNDLLEVYFHKYKALSDVKKRKLGNKYDRINLFLEGYNYDVWLETEQSSDKTKTDEKSTGLSSMSPLPGDEEDVREGKVLKILTPNKLLNRLSVLLALIKAGNNSCKLKTEIRHIFCLLYQHNKITKIVSNNLIKSL